MRSYLGTSQVHNSKDVSAFEAPLTDLATNTSHLCQKLWLCLMCQIEIGTCTAADDFSSV